MSPSPDSAPRGMRVYLLALAGLTTVQVVSTLCFNVAPLLAPAAAKDLGIAADDLAYFVSAGYLLCVVSAVSGGPVVRRVGVIRFSQVFLLILAAGCLLVASGSLPLVALAALVVGFGTGPMTVASSQLLSRVTPAHLSNVTFSIKQSGVPLGFALGGAVVPWIAVEAGWQVAAATVAGLALATAIAIAPLRALYDHDRVVSHARLLPRWAEIAEPLRLVWQDPLLRPMCLAAMLYSATQVTVVNFLVLYAINRLDMSYVAAGALLAAATLAGALGRIFWGAVADLSRRPLLTLVGIGGLMGVAALILAAAHAGWPGWLLYAVAIVLGGTAVGWNGVFLSLQARRAPPGRAGEITGATSMFVFGGPLLWPLIYRALISVSDSYVLGLIVVAVLVIASAAWLALRLSSEAR